MRLDLEKVLSFIRQHPKLVVSDDYELVVQKSDSHSVDFKNGEKNAEFRDSFWWVQLRVLHRKRVGVASTVFCEEDSLKAIVQNAFELADNSLVDPWFRFPLWRAETNRMGAQKDLFPQQVLGDEDFLESVYPEIEAKGLGLEEKYSDLQENRVVMRKTEKTNRFSTRSIQRLRFSLVNVGTHGCYRTEEIKGFEKSTKDKKKLLENLILKSERLRSQKSVNKSIPGKYVLNGRVVSYILKSLEPMLNGYDAGLGKLEPSIRVDEIVASEKVTLLDDGVLPGGEGSCRYDLEGTPGQKTALIEKGYLKTFLHDATSAARFNRVSTGNLVLGEKNLPCIGVTNLYLEPSSLRLSQLIDEMGDGIYVEGVERVDNEPTRSGKLTLLGYGWRVCQGQPVEPIRQIVIALHPLEIIKKISLVGGDLDFWGRYGSPSVFIEDLPLREV